MHLIMKPVRCFLKNGIRSIDIKVRKDCGTCIKNDRCRTCHIRYTIRLVSFIKESIIINLSKNKSFELTAEQAEQNNTQKASFDFEAIQPPSLWKQ